MPQFTTENVCYLKHGSREIMARVFKPEGAGPFPCYIDLHGGAWNNGDLEDRTGLGEYLAQRGIVMVTLNFRHGPDGYPTTLQDINYGIRWAKAHAKELKINPTRWRSAARRAAAIWRCWSRCGRTTRAMPRSRVRPASTPASRRSSCCGR